MRSFKKTLIAAALVSAGMAPAAESNQPVYWPAMAMMPVQFGNQVVMIPVSGWITPRGFLPAFAPGAGQPAVGAVLPPPNFFPAATLPPVPGLNYPAAPGSVALRPAAPYPAPVPGQVPMPTAAPPPHAGVMGGAMPFGPGMFAPGMAAPVAAAPGFPMGAPLLAPVPPAAQRLPTPAMMPPLPARPAPVGPGLAGGMAPRVAVAPPAPVMPGSAAADLPAAAATGTPAPAGAADAPDSAVAAEAQGAASDASSLPEAPALRTEAAMVSVPVSPVRPATQGAAAATGVASAGDRDGDGMPNELDLCPDRAGTGGRAGCPADEGVTLGGIVFRYDSDELTDASKEVLDRFAQKLVRMKGVRLEVAGHTDARGDAMYNLDLSERRARAVRNYLVEQGVSPSRLDAKGYGQSRPLADNESREGRATNRRVELKPV